MQDAGADDLVEALAEFASPLHGKMPQFEIREIVLLL